MQNKNTKLMLKRVAPLVVLVGLTGCVSVINVQMEKLRIRDEVMAAAKEVLACTDKLKASSKYAPLYAKLAADTRVPPTPAQLADEERPTDDDVQLGMEWFAEGQSCGQIGAEKFGRIDPELGAYVVRNMADNTALFREVISTRPTFGYINAKISEFHEKRLRESKRWAANLDTRLNQLKAEQEKAAAEQKKMFLSAVGAITEVAAAVFIGAVAGLAVQQNALAQAQRQYVVVPPAYRPVRLSNTSCSYIGRTLNCQQVWY